MHAVVRMRGRRRPGVPAAEAVEELAHQLDLLEGAQVAGVDGVKGDALLLPVVGDGLDLLGQVVEGKAGKPAGVGGQHRRGDTQVSTPMAEMMGRATVREHFPRQEIS